LAIVYIHPCPRDAALPRKQVPSVPEWLIKKSPKSFGRNVFSEDIDVIRDFVEQLVVRGVLKQDSKLKGNLEDKNELKFLAS
jgi:hypothetical protein